MTNSLWIFLTVQNVREINFCHRGTRFNPWKIQEHGRLNFVAFTQSLLLLTKLLRLVTFTKLTPGSILMVKSSDKQYGTCPGEVILEESRLYLVNGHELW